MKTLTSEAFIKAIRALGVPREQVKFVCPMCNVAQCGQDFIDAGAGTTFEDIEPLLGFSCIGRVTGASAPRATPDGKPCNWSLGGLFKVHRLEVVTPDGKRHPHFELAPAPRLETESGSGAESASRDESPEGTC